MYINYNANPNNERIGDCTTRALTLFLGIDYYTTKQLQYSIAKQLNVNYNTNNTVDIVTKRKTHVLDKRLSINKFCKLHPQGEYLIHTVNHCVYIKNGDYYDTWDSGSRLIKSYIDKNDKQENTNTLIEQATKCESSYILFIKNCNTGRRYIIDNKLNKHRNDFTSCKLYDINDLDQAQNLLDIIVNEKPNYLNGTDYTINLVSVFMTTKRINLDYIIDSEYLNPSY